VQEGPVMLVEEGKSVERRGTFAAERGVGKDASEEGEERVASPRGEELFQDWVRVGVEE